MKSAVCPSCGAPVVFHSTASLYAVCEFCRSTLLRDGEDLKNIGRMADLLEDASLLQIGSEGVYRGLHFGVIGRIQLKHESGLWNEWYLLFDDGRNAWLSEAGGEFILSRQQTVSEILPDFAALEPEVELTLAGRVFTVSCLDAARCIAGQGELPFKVESGYDVQTADLRSADQFVTLDYSETPPLVFVGRPVGFDELKLANLRSTEAVGAGAGVPRVKARAFNCPHCASPLAIHSAAIESVACASCGSILGVDNENVQLLSRAAQAMRETPALPLGSCGELQGIAWEVIGFLRRKSSCEGIDYPWSEYLLFNEQQGFAWLVEYQGHWNFARTLSKPPSAKRQVRNLSFEKQDYKLFSRSRAEVSYVVGEFYWRVTVGESALIDDFVCPPRLLSRELMKKEVSWSQSEYLEPEVVAKAFKLATLPPRLGVYANQPNPHLERHRQVCSLFWKMFLAATVLQLLFVFVFSGKAVLNQQLSLPPKTEEGAQLSQDFVLTGRARNLRVTHQTNIDNNWLALSTVLVEKNTGQTYQGNQDIGYYHGVDGGESWNEGNRESEVVFKRIPAGTYHLVLEYELGPDNPQAVLDRIEILPNVPGWSNYVLLSIFLLVFPLISRWRRGSFEAARWRESDLSDPTAKKSSTESSTEKEDD